MHTSVWAWTLSLGIWDVGPCLPEQRGALPWGIPLEQWAAVEASLTPSQWSQCDVFSTAEREKTDVLLFLYYLWGGSSVWCPRSRGSSVLRCFNSIAVVLLDKRCSFPNQLTMCLCTLLKARTCCLFCVQPAILRAMKCTTSSTTSLQKLLIPHLSQTGRPTDRWGLRARLAWFGGHPCICCGVISCRCTTGLKPERAAG